MVGTESSNGHLEMKRENRVMQLYSYENNHSSPMALGFYIKDGCTRDFKSSA